MPVDPALRESIQSAYSAYLNGRSLNARRGQKQMIGTIANYLSDIESNAEGERASDPRVCVVEAGTGTGKTLAYLTALIPFAQALGKKVVIGTATVTLQQQILENELPEFREHSGLPFRASLAKGRGRYLCLNKLDLFLQQGDSDLFGVVPEQGGEGGPARYASEDYEALLAKMSTQGWDGDMDHLDEVVDEGLWKTVTVDHRQCLNRSCQYLSQCPYYRAKGDQESAEVIVANHDLILSDLALGGGVVLPPPQDSLYIIDEAHHLPDKTLSHFSTQASFSGVRSSLNALSRLCVDLPSQSHYDTEVVNLSQDLTPHIQSYHQALNLLQEWVAEHVDWDQERDNSPCHYRFPNGELPESLPALLETILPLASRVFDQYERLLERAKALSEDRSTGLQDDGAWSRSQVSLASLARGLEGQLALWRSLLAEQLPDQHPLARWLTTAASGEAEEARWHASPTDASTYLLESLWSECYAAVLASATLSLQGDFSYFSRRTGLPEGSLNVSYPSPFDYPRQGRLRFLDMGMEPGDREDYFDALAATLIEQVDPQQGTLVLFNARRHLQEVSERLQGSDRPEGFWLVQEGANRALILDEHRARVKRGEGSCLMGLASFAEGLDLPGKALEHVLITRLPFSVPDNPVEAALSEWLEAQGKSPFFEVSLPQATIRLIQACGRLLRSEQDVGRITLLDRRLWTRRYGSRMLNALPPFYREGVVNR